MTREERETRNRRLYEIGRELNGEIDDLWSHDLITNEEHNKMLEMVDAIDSIRRRDNVDYYIDVDNAGHRKD